MREESNMIDFLAKIVVSMILVAGFIYGTILVLIMILGKKGVSEANQKIFETLEILSRRVQSPVTFNVLVGFDGLSFSDNYINKVFSNIYKLFNIFYFVMVYQWGQNLIVYQFRVYEEVKELRRGRLLSLCQAIGEEVLAEHFHQNCFFPVNLSEFVAITLQADTLRIFYARNSNGFAEIAEIKRRNH
jgi:hypothetical protein